MEAALNGKYVIDRHLGGGGMAEVFLARTVGAEGFMRRVAIKRVLPAYSQRAHFATLFVAEAQLTAQLQHPNIVSVLDFDRDHEGGLFLVMELIDGTDLDGLLTSGPLPFPLIIFVATEILRGLAYAHDLPTGDQPIRGVIHRDISPHNVLLSWQGAVKVSDFGIAKAREATEATASLLIKGKPAYMSPEQARGEPLDGRSDLFAVGVMLFEMLCHQPLFRAETTAATLIRLLTAPIPTPREVRPDVPEDLSRVVATLLQRDRNQRFADAHVASSALVSCLDYPRDGRELLVTTLAERFVGRAPTRVPSGMQLPALISGPLPRITSAPSAATVTARGRARLPPARRWPWVLVAVLVVALGSAIVVAASGGEPGPSLAPPAGPAGPFDGSNALPPGTPLGATAAASSPPPTASGSAESPVVTSSAAERDTQPMRNGSIDAGVSDATSSGSASGDASKTEAPAEPGSNREHPKPPGRRPRPADADGIRQVHL